MRNLSLHARCSECKKQYDDDSKGVVIEDDDRYVFICELCENNLEMFK